MADQLDNAQVVTDLHLKISLQRRKEELQSTGTCHWCKESVSDNAHFCDTDCRDDYQQDKRRRG